MKKFHWEIARCTNYDNGVNGELKLLSIKSDIIRGLKKN